MLDGVLAKQRAWWVQVARAITGHHTWKCTRAAYPRTRAMIMNVGNLGKPGVPIGGLLPNHGENAGMFLKGSTSFHEYL